MKRLVILLLFLSPGLAKVIISSPKGDSMVSRGLINIVGVSDESGVVDLSLYEPLSGEQTPLGSVAPDVNGFWNLTFNSFNLSESHYYLIANTLLDKSSVYFGLRDELELSLSVPDSVKRGSTIKVIANVESINGSPVSNLDLLVNNSVSEWTITLSKTGSQYEGYLDLPLQAVIGEWVLRVNDCTNQYVAVSKPVSFQVIPVNLTLNFISGSSFNQGLNELVITGVYPNGESLSLNELSVNVTKPSGESFNSVFSRHGSQFSKELLLDETGEWLLSASACELSNCGSFTDSFIVSDELALSIIDSSILKGKDKSILVDSVDGSFSLNGFPATINQVIPEGDYQRIFFTSNLPPGIYPFSLTVSDGDGNSGITSGSFIINDLVLESCLSEVCASDNEPVFFDEPGLLSGSLSLSDGSLIDARVKLMTKDYLINDLSVINGVFSFDLSNSNADEFLLIVDHEGLFASNVFYKQGVESFIEFPSFVELIKGSIVNVDFNASGSLSLSDLPAWASLVDDSLLINSSGLGLGLHSVTLNGLLGGESFIDELIVLVKANESLKSIGNLSILNVAFDLNNSGIVLKVSNPDFQARELVINHSNSLTTYSVGAFNETDLFIPLVEGSNDLSVISGDSVLLDVDSETVDGVLGSKELIVQSENSLLVPLLIAGYPLLIFGFLGWLYSDSIKSSVIKSKGRVVQFFKRFNK